jgi:dihydroxyacetone kinase-like protein
MNFALAAEMCASQSDTVITDDDVAVARSSATMGRRGVAGTMIVEKVVGAAAERGETLQALKALGTRVNAMTRSMGVALTSCTVPAVGHPTFDIGDADMEVGVGIHGEPGRRRTALQPADAIAELMVQAIVDDLELRPADDVLVLVNGFGGTPAMELYLMFDAAYRQIERQGVRIARSHVGNFVTSLDMAGCSITVTKLDAEIAGLWDAPVHTAALRW